MTGFVVLHRESDLEQLTPQFVRGCAAKAERNRTEPGTSTRPAQERGSYLVTELAKLKAVEGVA